MQKREFSGLVLTCCLVASVDRHGWLQLRDGLREGEREIENKKKGNFVEGIGRINAEAKK